MSTSGSPKRFNWRPTTTKWKPSMPKNGKIKRPNRWWNGAQRKNGFFNQVKCLKRSQYSIEPMSWAHHKRIVCVILKFSRHCASCRTIRRQQQARKASCVRYTRVKARRRLFRSSQLCRLYAASRSELYHIFSYFICDFNYYTRHKNLFKVDVITSNSVLAEESIRDRFLFFQLLRLSVGSNKYDEKYMLGINKAYTCNIVYGSIESFQFDYLRHTFLGILLLINIHMLPFAKFHNYS